jgi:AbrB family looped-hinge helix DNA binding protein
MIPDHGIFRAITMAAKYTTLSKSGRLSIPAEFRRAVGLEHGGDVIVDLEGGKIRIRTVAEAVARAQMLTKESLGSKSKASVADFIAERRKEARRE